MMHRSHICRKNLKNCTRLENTVIYLTSIDIFFEYFKISSISCVDLNNLILFPFKELLIKAKKRYKNLKYKRLGKLKIKDTIFVIFDMIYELEHM